MALELSEFVGPRWCGAGCSVMSNSAPDGQNAKRLDVQPGTIIDGTYRIVGNLGAGGMGVVLLGHDERLDRAVAIKLILPSFVEQSDFRKRFIAEARAMARVRHENVVAIHSFGEFEDAPYFVMELVRGPTLLEWLEKRGDAPPSVDEAVGILSQACRGVQAIHDAGAVHNDIKPSNILLGAGFRVAITDLGLARRVTSPSTSGALAMGTPDFMAPEIISARKVDDDLATRADVYALGVIAYQLFTGRLPFIADTPTALLDKHLLEQPAPPSSISGHLPASFDEPILSALRKDPSERTASARELMEHLTEARGGVSSTGRLRIVVADDDDDMLTLVAATVQGVLPRADVEVVPDGHAALESLDRESAHLVIADLDMPGLNGIELVAALRGSDEGARTPVLVMTAFGGAKDWKVLSELGADAFLVKPFEPPDLGVAVQRLLGLAPDTGPMSVASSSRP